MSASMPSQWLSGGASVIGAAHIRHGKPNQDAFLADPQERGAGRFLVCVADGHGGDAYFRSDVGARLAVEAFVEAMSWTLDTPDKIDSLPQDLVTIWRSLVSRHSVDNPLDDALAPSTFEPYGSTLVGVAATEQLCIVVQIGDGDLVLGYPDGSVLRPLGADTELQGEQTYSLCTDDAAQRVKYKLLSRAEPWPDFALVATDGVSKSFVDDATFLDVVTHYRELVRSGDDLRATIAALPDWLRQVSDNGSGDDATLCIASCRYN